MSTTTDEELARLAADEVPPEKEVVVACYFSCFGVCRGQLRAFRDAQLEAGFTGLGADDEDGDPHYLHAWSFTVRRADPAELRAAAELAAALAETHGARLDGWEVRRNSDGSLHPVES